MAQVRSEERGFTLVEVLVVTATIMLLAAIGLTVFQVYKSSAAYAVMAQSFADARRSLEAGINNFDAAPPAVNFTQQVPGELLDAAARQLMPAFRVPANVKIEVSYNPACTDRSCESAYVELRHCQASEHIRWTRLGDGLDLLLEHIAGGGC